MIKSLNHTPVGRKTAKKWKQDIGFGNRSVIWDLGSHPSDQISNYVRRDQIKQKNQNTLSSFVWKSHVACTHLLKQRLTNPSLVGSKSTVQPSHPQSTLPFQPLREGGIHLEQTGRNTHLSCLAKNLRNHLLGSTFWASCLYICLF